MKRRLLLLRHAKSSWADPGLADFDRPLNKRGVRAAPLMAQYIGAKGLRPDLVFCSAALRTRQTWDLVAAELGGETTVKVLKSLYLASPSRLLAAVRQAPDEVARLMVLGHNPGLERFAAELCGPGSDRKALARLADKFPTCALAVIRFDSEGWSKVARGGGRLERFVVPRDL